ncbi:MAG TPA: hypothetical protein VHV79_13465 [Mycobacteriales bacterium]|jgi:hypothetical protein|nr:hypothetical protein [Mycobacteriales bacterium]
MSRRNIAIALIVLGISLFFMITFWNGFIQFLGVRNEASRWYAFESGSGAIILGDLPLLGGLVLLIRHHNCEIPGCARIQMKRPTAAGHLLCRRHHPAPGPQSVEEAHAAHRAALASQGGA